MSSEVENKICQNCKNEFLVELDDFGFYEQMKVPLPTWCPKCRLQRRLAWTGYHILYKRLCAWTGEQSISIYHPDSPYITYKQDIWWSDKWDPKDYGRDYGKAGGNRFQYLQPYLNLYHNPHLNHPH